MKIVFALKLLPCAYKSVFGIDCPVCGFQRAFLLLIHGNFIDSVKMYSPLIPVLLLGIMALLRVIKPGWIKKTFLSGYSLLVLIIIIVNYSIKLVS